MTYMLYVHFDGHPVSLTSLVNQVWHILASYDETDSIAIAKYSKDSDAAYNLI
jgi:hypothetical protein